MKGKRYMPNYELTKQASRSCQSCVCELMRSYATNAWFLVSEAERCCVKPGYYCPHCARRLNDLLECKPFKVEVKMTEQEVIAGSLALGYVVLENFDGPDIYQTQQMMRALLEKMGSEHGIDWERLQSDASHAIR